MSSDLHSKPKESRAKEYAIIEATLFTLGFIMGVLICVVIIIAALEFGMWILIAFVIPIVWFLVYKRALNRELGN